MAIQSEKLIDSAQDESLDFSVPSKFLKAISFFLALFSHFFYAVLRFTYWGLIFSVALALVSGILYFWILTPLLHFFLHPFS